MKILIVHILLCVVSPIQTYAAFCSSQLSALSNKTTDPTDKLTSYLSLLLDQKVIGDSQLLLLIASLEKGTIVNPISANEVTHSSKALIHSSELQSQISNRQLNLNTLLEWARRTLESRQEVKVARSETKTATADTYEKMIFFPIPPGTFKIDGKFGKVQITRPFEMMSTLVTQKQWVDIMGDNPSHYQNGEGSIVLTIDGKSIRLHPDHPVENVTWWSAVEFANRVSIQAGIKPAYTLKPIQIGSGSRAEDGSLRGAFEVVINAPEGDIYQTEGYRLPTETEYEHVLRINNPTSSFYFGESRTELLEHAWIINNSAETTHPVAQLLPHVVSGKTFYDMHGNVAIWMHNQYQTTPPGGKNPQGPRKKTFRTFRGSTFKDSGTGFREGVPPNTRVEILGLRLVRTLK